MITLFNPTDERMEPSYGGVTIPLDPGEVKEVEDAAANHILSRYDSRGLCRLKFGDEKEAVAKDGQERNHEFKKRMVMNQNQLNLARGQKGLPYVTPTPQVKQYAKDLGLILDEPFTTKHNEEADEKNALLKQIAALLEKDARRDAEMEELRGLVRSIADNTIIEEDGPLPPLKPKKVRTE